MLEVFLDVGPAEGGEEAPDVGAVLEGGWVGGGARDGYRFGERVGDVEEVASAAAALEFIVSITKKKGGIVVKNDVCVGGKGGIIAKCLNTTTNSQ